MLSDAIKGHVETMVRPVRTSFFDPRTGEPCDSRPEPLRREQRRETVEERNAAIAKRERDEKEKAEAEALAKAEAAAIAAAKPGTPSVKLSSPAKGKLTVKASAKKAKGYRVYYKKAGWKAYKTFTTTGTVKSLSKTFKKLSKGSYTVKVRAFGKTATGKIAWSAKSKAKKAAVK